MLLDIAPTVAMYENTTQAFATAYWHWFFLIQPPPLPEALIESDPVRYIRSVMGKRHAGLAAFAPEAMAEYARCGQIAGTAHAICEDYRASCSIDLLHDRADIASGRKLEQPVKVLWGEHGAVGQCFDVMPLWRERATQVTGNSLPCGHYIAEEVPELLIPQKEIIMSKKRIAVIAGDGIGKEVMPEGIRVMEAAASKFGIDLQFDHFDFSSWDYFEKHGKMLPDNWKDQIGGHDAIYFGAVGWPDKIADHVSLWGSLLLFRREFDQYINLRPARLMPGIIAPV
eukprot:gene25351-46363_t